MQPETVQLGLAEGVVEQDAGARHRDSRPVPARTVTAQAVPSASTTEMFAVLALVGRPASPWRSTVSSSSWPAVSRSGATSCTSAR